MRASDKQPRKKRISNKRSENSKNILEFIRNHPGCKMGDIIRHTGLSQPIINGAMMNIESSGMLLTLDENNRYYIWDELLQEQD